jgi:hypothetical protein
VLGAPDNHPAVQRGHISLLETELLSSGDQPTVGIHANDINDLSGNWVVANHDFYKRYIALAPYSPHVSLLCICAVCSYHAAYCGIIGLADLHFDASKYVP